MFSSLRLRLWLTYALIVVLAMVIAGAAILVYLLRNPVIDRRELQRLRLVANLISQRTQPLGELENRPGQANLDQFVQRIDSTSNARIAFFSSDGQLLADSRASSAAALPDLNSLRRVIAEQTSTFRDASGEQWLYVLTRVDNDLFLLVSAPRVRLSFVSLLRDELLTPFVRGTLLALVISLLMAFWIANSVTHPLQRITRATQTISSGTFQKIPLQGPKEVKALAQAFNEMGEQVQASQRSQRDFIANVSHDLKTPLTSIQGFAQAILDGTADETESLHQAAGVIYDEAGRMNRMVLDLLELARIDSGVVAFERERVDLIPVLRRVVEKFTPQAEQAQVRLQADLPAALPALVGDGDRLVQVFTNLVENALKFSPAGGLISVSASQIEGWIEVRIIDSGPGIPEDELPRVFERFYQTDKSRTRGARSGVGLGLAIVREIVQTHGGKISAYNRSAAGVRIPGSEFVVHLPLQRSDDSTLARRRL